MKFMLKCFYFWLVLYNLYVEVQNRGFMHNLAIIYKNNETNSNFHCFGTFVARHIILSSCTCVGRFDTGKLVVFDLAQYLALDTFENPYTLVASEVHPKCSPSDFDPSIIFHNLGVWRTKKPTANHMGDVISRSDFPQIPRPCMAVILSQENGNTWAVPYTTKFDNIAVCLAEYCEDNEDSCGVLTTMAKQLRILCVMYDKDDGTMPESANGSPVVCQSMLWGVVSSASNESLFWMSLSWEDDFNFILSVTQKSRPSTMVNKFYLKMIILTVTFGNIIFNVS